MSKCIVCEKSDLRELKSFSKYPLCIGVLPKKLLGKIKSPRLSIGECRSCGHIQQIKVSVNKDMIYKEEYSELLSSVPTPSKTSIGRVEAQMSFDFFMSYNLPKGKVLDIGCYDGYFLSLIKKKGYKVHGIEPNSASNIAREKYKIPIIQDFFSNKYFEKNTFDIIILRNILEHIAGINDFLEDVNRVLKPNGHVFIEVPNTPFLLRKRAAGIFFHQHLSYFSYKVLMFLLSKHHLKPMKSKNDYFIYLLVKKGNDRNINKAKMMNESSNAIAKDYFSRYKRRIQDLKNILKDRNRVAIFGAGGDTTDLIHMLDGSFDRKIKFVYDNNKLKHGNFLAELPIAVRSPEDIKRDKPEAVIVSTYLHQEDIVGQLKEMNIDDLKIVSLYPKVRFIN